MMTIKVKELVDLEEENKELDVLQLTNVKHLTKDEIDLMKREKSLERREMIANVLLGISIGALVMTVVILYRTWKMFG